jgi:3,5-epimerase/4-reductase
VNLTNPGLITHNEILEMYKEIVDREFTWENFDIAEQQKILESERSNNYLDTARLESMYNVLHIKDSVREVLVTMKNTSCNV